MRKEYILSWLKAAGIRAIKTVCQVAASTIGTTAMITQVNWWNVASAALLAGILSMITSLAGLPELDASTNRKWIVAAGIRAIKTVAYAAAATIGTAELLGDVNWMALISGALLAGVLSILTSVAGIPEAKSDV
jgi:hypothetical protein